MGQRAPGTRRRTKVAQVDASRSQYLHAASESRMRQEDVGWARLYPRSVDR